MENKSRDEIFSLRGLQGFDNSLAFDDRGHTPTKAACLARNVDMITGVFGAAPVSPEGLWEVGVDVLPEYRNSGMGTYLVTKLTGELLERDVVPFYSASVTNIGSQMVAARCGYIPAWVDAYGTVLDGSSPYGDLLHIGVGGDSSIMSPTFEFDGEKYKKASRHQKEWGSSLIGELSLRVDEKILDLGCADGAAVRAGARWKSCGNRRVCGNDRRSAEQVKTEPDICADGYE